MRLTTYYLLGKPALYHVQACETAGGMCNSTSSSSEQRPGETVITHETVSTHALPALPKLVAPQLRLNARGLRHRRRHRAPPQ